MAEGNNIRGHYLLTRKELKPFSTKPGKFLLMQLSDKTGDIRGIVWDQGEKLAAELEVGDVLEIEGRVGMFRESLQIVCGSVLQSLAGQYSPEEFLPTTTRDPRAMARELQEYREGIGDEDCRRLLKTVFTDEFTADFVRAPAARTMHQAYVGGLIEHTLNVVRICETVLELYPQVDRDLLLTGALLHDVGKVQEYALGAGIDITDAGRLLGHVSLGYRLVSDAIAGLDGFAEEKALRLAHMLLSHHGELAWGSPKEPQTVEACILHYADNLDGQVSKYMEILESGGTGQRWTAFDRRLGRSLFIGEQDNLAVGTGDR